MLDHGCQIGSPNVIFLSFSDKFVMSVMKIFFIFTIISLVYATEVIVPISTLTDVSNAIANADAGTTVTLSPGTWTGCASSINLSKNITLNGAGAVIDCGGSGTAIIIQQDATGSIIQHLHVVDAATAIAQSFPGVIIIRNMTISRNKQAGVVVSVGDAIMTMYDTVFIGGSYHAIQLSNSARYNGYNITIRDYTVSLNAASAGVVMTTNSWAVLYNSKLFNLTFTGAVDGGAVRVSASRFEAYDTTFVKCGIASGAIQWIC